MARNIVFLCLTYFIIIATLLWISQFLVPSSICQYFDLLARLLLGGVIAYETFPLVKKTFFNKKLPVHKKSVLITGCDSGFGFNLAKRLDSRGYQVFASCLLPSGEGARILKQSCSSCLHVLGLDVTKDESVKEALSYVKENLNNTELWALVNNAGYGTGFETEWTMLKNFQDSLDVNTIGVVRVTKAFLPLLRRSKGRIVTVTSLAGRVSASPFTPYSMSKFAASCFCDCLRQEMHPWGVKVITIEPEAFRTPILDERSLNSKADESLNCLDKDTREEYGEKYFNAIKKLIEDYIHEGASDKLHKVIDDMEEAVSLEEPNYAYRPRINVFHRCIFEVFEHLPQPVIDRLLRLLYYYYYHVPYPKEAEHRF